MTLLGLDIGGANIKGADATGCAVWPRISRPDVYVSPRCGRSNTFSIRPEQRLLCHSNSYQFNFSNDCQGRKEAGDVQECCRALG